MKFTSAVFGLVATSVAGSALGAQKSAESANSRGLAAVNGDSQLSAVSQAMEEVGQMIQQIGDGSTSIVVTKVIDEAIEFFIQEQSFMEEYGEVPVAPLLRDLVSLKTNQFQAQLNFGAIGDSIKLGVRNTNSILAHVKGSSEPASSTTSALLPAALFNLEKTVDNTVSRAETVATALQGIETSADQVNHTLITMAAYWKNAKKEEHAAYQLAVKDSAEKSRVFCLSLCVLAPVAVPACLACLAYQEPIFLRDTLAKFESNLDKMSSLLEPIEIIAGDSLISSELSTSFVPLLESTTVLIDQSAHQFGEYESFTISQSSVDQLVSTLEFVQAAAEELGAKTA